MNNYLLTASLAKPKQNTSNVSSPPLLLFPTLVFDNNQTPNVFFVTLQLNIAFQASDYLCYSLPRKESTTKD